MAVVSGATALLLLDVTVVNVALPAIARDLGAGFTALQWVVDAYAVALAAALLTAGSLADRLGRRRVFTGGLALFTAASAACAAAPSATALDVARAIQGVGGAAMFAPSLAMLAAAYPEGRARASALTVWGIVTGAALAIGPLVGGGLVDTLGWEAVFWLNLPLGALLIAGALRLAETRDAAAAPTDWRGAALWTGAIVALVAGLLRGRETGWDSAPIVLALAGGAGLLAAFVAVELRARAPMLDPRLFARPPFAGTALVSFAQSFALYPMFLFLALHFQGTLGFTPWETGLRLLPVTLVLFAVAPLSARLTGVLELRVALCAGLVLIAAGLLLMRRVAPGEGWEVLLPGFVVGGAGIGVISPALAAAMVSVLPVERAGLASGINNTFRQLGIAVGVAVLGILFAGAPQTFAGLDRIVLCGAVVALASVPPAWLALGGLRSGDG